MTLHILKKDLMHLAPLVALVAAAQIANSALWFALGNFEEPRGLVVIAYAFSGITVLGIVALIASAVHLEMLPGVSQDWLVRPIRRIDLVAAKLSFVLVAVHVPMFAADVGHGIGAGFPIADSLWSAAVRSLYMLLVVDVPALALAALTRSLVQVAAASLGIWIVVIAGVAIGVVARGGDPPPFAASGMQWMTPAFWTMVAAVAGAVIVAIQYSRRATARARFIALGAVLLAPVLSYSTWASAFAIQVQLSVDPAAAKSVGIDVDPAIGPSAGEPTSHLPDSISLPLRVSGLAPGAWVLNDRTYVRLVSDEGATLYSGKTTATIGYGDDFLVRTAVGDDVLTHQRIVFPPKVYALLSTQAVRMELDYSLTLLQVATTTSIAATNASNRSAGLGWCKTRVDDDGDDVEIGCLRSRGSPPCLTARLVNPTTGAQNPEEIFCEPDYSPFGARLFPDAVSHFAGEMRFRDLHGLARYPVDGAQLGSATVVLNAYRPRAHFTRRVVVPSIRLSDWATG